MNTVQIQIEKSIAEKAILYANERGIKLSAMIESFLSRITKAQEAEQTEEIPEVVHSLLGAGTPVDEDDLNGRKAYYAYLEEKHQ